jgi:hypothetical protein
MNENMTDEELAMIPDVDPSEIGPFDCLNPDETLISFERALKLLKEGRYVTRLIKDSEKWNGRFLQLCTDIVIEEVAGFPEGAMETKCEEAEVIDDKIIVIRGKTMDDAWIPWAPNMDDILSEDWAEVLESVETD